MPLAYTMVKNDPAHGDMRTMAKMECAGLGCRNTVKVPMVGMSNNPERIEKLFLRQGWEIDVHNAKKNFCPKCLKRREEIKQAEKEQQEAQQPQRRVLPALPTARAPEHFNIGAGTRTPKESQMNTVRDLSNQQKSLLRTAIEGYFNADTGRYEDGWSDHRISEESQIPRKVVEEFREGYFGPLKANPELVALREDIEKSKTIVGNMQSTLQKLETRLAALEKKGVL